MRPLSSTSVESERPERLCTYASDGYTKHSIFRLGDDTLDLLARADLFDDAETSKNVTFYDLRGAGITWEALAGTVADAHHAARRAHDLHHHARPHPRG